MSSHCSKDLPRVVMSWSSPVVVLSRTFLCCVSCVPPCLPLPAYYPIARVLGVVFVRPYLVLCVRVSLSCVRSHDTSYPMMDCIHTSLLCLRYGPSLLMLLGIPYD